MQAFAATLAELEELVAQLESDELPLADAVRGLERGVDLVRQAAAQLDAGVGARRGEPS